MNKNKKNKMENPMRKIKIEKVILHCGSGDPGKLERSIKLLKKISNMNPIKTKAKKRIPGFKIRPGLAIGCKVTLRGKKAIRILKLLLDTIGNKLRKKNFSAGFFNFGIKEYIEIPNMKYDREIGILGFDVSVCLKRAGFRIEKRKIKKNKIPKRHKISREETIKFAKENLNLDIK